MMKSGDLDIEIDTHRKQYENTQGEGGHLTGVMHLQAKECQGLAAHTRS